MGAPDVPLPAAAALRATFPREVRIARRCHARSATHGRRRPRPRRCRCLCYRYRCRRRSDCHRSCVRRRDRQPQPPSVPGFQCPTAYPRKRLQRAPHAARGRAGAWSSDGLLRAPRRRRRVTHSPKRHRRRPTRGVRAPSLRRRLRWRHQLTKLPQTGRESDSDRWRGCRAAGCPYCRTDSPGRASDETDDEIDSLGGSPGRASDGGARARRSACAHRAAARA